MKKLELEKKISKLYDIVGIKTGYQKQNGTPEYFQQLKKTADILEQQCNILILQGIRIDRIVLDKIKHLKTLSS